MCEPYSQLRMPNQERCVRDDGEEDADPDPYFRAGEYIFWGEGGGGSRIH